MCCPNLPYCPFVFPMAEHSILSYLYVIGRYGTFTAAVEETIKFNFLIRRKQHASQLLCFIFDEHDWSMSISIIVFIS